MGRETVTVRLQANPLKDPVVRVEDLEVRARDTYKIEISALGRAGILVEILVELIGEFDIHDLGVLRKVLSLVLSARLPTHVDLSRVTFLDVGCARELATRSWLYDHLMLRDPSWEAKASLKVCGREACIASYPCEGSPMRRGGAPRSVSADGV
jgi:hypothetical protein